MSEIEFELNGFKLKIVDNLLIYYWYDHNSAGKLKKPYWRLKKMKPNRYGYLTTGINNKSYYFHRVVYKSHNPNWDMTYTPDNQIDHIDCNKLNNNINNLRVVNNRENKLNTDGVRNAKGYCFDKSRNKYVAYIYINNKHKHLGRFDTKDEAHNVYLNKRYELYGF